MRLHLAITRAFDPDEFAYLHWTWLITHGYIPYRDFFFYILPGFPWFLSPFLALTGDSVNFLIASRILMCIMYGLCAWMVYQMTKKITDTIPALLATLIFLTFPVTIDKTIDVRPDMVMLLLYFGNVLLLFQPQKVRPFEAKILLSGVMFGASVIVFPKIIFGLPAVLYLLLFQNFIRPPLALRNSGLTAKGVALKILLPWFIGVGLVGLGFLGYLGVNNLIPQAITSITKDALAVTIGKGGFSPLLLLSPYPLIYLTQGGVSLPWAVNTGVWISGIIGLALLFFHPNQVSSVPDTCPSNKRMGLFWILFIGGNILFVAIFPVPYVQYLLPLSVAASVLGGYTLSVIPGLTRNPVPNLRWIPAFAGMTIPVLLLSSVFLQYRERTAPGAGNSEQLQVIRDVLKITKPNESVYDMVGSYVFRPDGYFICCHPYAEFGQLLASRPGLERELRESLIARQTKFLVMDRVGFVFWKSLDADKAFLLTNYLPMGNPSAPGVPLSKLYSLGQTYRCQSGACVQYDMEKKPAGSRSTNALTVIVAENYTVTIEPNTATIMIDGKEIRTNQTIELATGAHRFMTDQTTTEFRFQMKRD
ncbi:MAG: glycosyltransferase family 39 protein [Patescibacteria group bacterium]